MSASDRELYERLHEKARGGNAEATARMLSVALDGGAKSHVLAEVLRGRPRTAHIVGVTGPPGAGKSTLVGALAHGWPGEGRVAILAVDPTSPISGGSILGDRVRMKQVSGDSRVYMRSVASNGRTDGLSLGIERATDLLSTLDFETVIIETVGVGQVEIEITSLADTTIAVFTPGQGDVVQAVKSGLNEVTDIFVVNKMDQGGGDTVIRDLRRVTRAAVGSAEEAEHVWQRPVVGVTATEAAGLDKVVDEIVGHREYLERTGEAVVRQTSRGRLQLESALEEYFREALHGYLRSENGTTLAYQLSIGKLTVIEIAEEIVAELIQQVESRLLASGS